ncbi:MAG: kynureninase, partial [Ramlibacter sp.]|nr:kynureninase [Ramlibacter sp.]
MTHTLQTCRAMDAHDPLRTLRELFVVPEGVTYLDGNSLGVMPKAAAARVAQVATEEWAQGLIRSWNSAGWFTMPQRLGDKLAQLIGAKAGEVVVTDSTSINLYKVLSAALKIAASESPQRKVIVSERTNFPTDLYIAEGLCKTNGLTLELVHDSAIAAAMRRDVAVLMLTHVNYRTGAMHDMSAITSAAHAAG